MMKMMMTMVMTIMIMTMNNGQDSQGPRGVHASLSFVALTNNKGTFTPGITQLYHA